MFDLNKIMLAFKQLYENNNCLKVPQENETEPEPEDPTELTEFLRELRLTNE
jgi:hypothetical protein